MTVPPSKESGRLDTLEQMCAASSDTYLAGQWCHAANELLLLAHGLKAERDALREAARPIARAIENRAAQEAYNAGLGASEWRGFTFPDEDEFLRLLALERPE